MVELVFEVVFGVLYGYGVFVAGYKFFAEVVKVKKG